MEHRGIQGVGEQAEYLKEYRRALRNVLSHTQLSTYLKGSTPIFLFGLLSLPAMLKSLTDADNRMDQAINMTQASLLHHKLYIFEGSDIPLIMPSADSTADVRGLLVFNLSPERRGWIHDFEATNETELRNVQVEIVLDDGNLCIIEAGAFVWQRGLQAGIVKAESNQWMMDKFLKTGLYETATSGYLSC
ncbi:hypothetical protein FQN57_001296 [Myotisia sp. PD_48]|nr:hypothetical protein FQN57_001296 [Myotisia sp. PD_48]